MRIVLCLLIWIAVHSLGYSQASKQVKDVADKNSFYIAIWNIGHFAKGIKSHSLIIPAELEEKIAAYRSFVNDSIHADILCLNEYESVFCKDSAKRIMAKDVLFDKFQYCKIYKKNIFVCNAIFSQKRILNAKMWNYTIPSKTIDSLPKHINWFYYVTADLEINGKVVKLVCVHLINRAPKFNRDQMQQLANIFKEEERVVICGDMNTRDWRLLKNAGFKCANNGELKSFPSKLYALDNIFVKGLEISDVKMIKTELSDHYPIVCKILIM